MKKEEYEHLIYYTICDTIFNEVKNTNFSTVGNLCKTISTNITYGTSISTEEYKVLSKTIKEISFMYGLSDNETIDITNTFFKKEMWLVYSDIIGVMRAHLKFFS
jgi:hypothetical protein|tara:strand:- start:1818 stop:2132 length:315 start_codon:yes stop_codon:yes gene_type:complete